MLIGVPIGTVALTVILAFVILRTRRRKGTSSFFAFYSIHFFFFTSVDRQLVHSPSFLQLSANSGMLPEEYLASHVLTAALEDSPSENTPLMSHATQ